MGRPLRAVYANSTYSTGVREMSDSDINNLASEVILAAAITNSGLETVVRVNPGAGDWLNIGTAYDIINSSVGAHPAANTVVSTYTFYQSELTQTPLTLTARPVHYANVGGVHQIKEMTDQELIDYLIPPVVQTSITGGRGAYYLSLTSSPPGTGTWVSRAVLNDTYYNSSNVYTTDSYTLWQRTTGASLGTIRPLKRSVVGAQVRLVEMTDIEIGDLYKVIGEYVRTVGIGRYALQTTSPVSGTWINRGSFTDTVNNLTNTAYTGFYAGSFTGFYGVTYTGFYSGTYSSTYAGSYSGTYAGPSYAASYVGSYSGPSYAGQSVGYFTGPSYASSSVGYYTGPSYSVKYVNNSQGPSYAGSYTGTYAGPAFAGSYTGTYAGPSFTGSFSGTYTGPSYAGTFVGNYVTSYVSEGGSFDVYFTGYYAGPSFAGAYSGTYTGPSYAGSYSGTYTGPSYAGSFSGTYTGPSYAAGFTGFYQGPSYSSQSTVYFTGPGYASSSVVYYTGPSYAASYTGSYSGPSYSASYTGFYAGSRTYFFTGSYTGSYGLTYTGFYSSSFTGYYSGLTVQSTSTTTTYTLWVRTA